MSRRLLTVATHLGDASITQSPSPVSSKVDRPERVPPVRQEVVHPVVKQAFVNSFQGLIEDTALQNQLKPHLELAKKNLETLQSLPDFAQSSTTSSSNLSEWEDVLHDLPELEPLLDEEALGVRHQALRNSASVVSFSSETGDSGEVVNCSPNDLGETSPAQQEPFSVISLSSKGNDSPSSVTPTAPITFYSERLPQPFDPLVHQPLPRIPSAGYIEAQDIPIVALFPNLMNLITSTISRMWSAICSFFGFKETPGDDDKTPPRESWAPYVVGGALLLIFVIRFFRETGNVKMLRMAVVTTWRYIRSVLASFS